MSPPWPSPKGAVAVSEFMTALAEAKALGLTRQIGVSNFGVSNFTIDLMRQAIEVVGAEQLATNQIGLPPLPA